MEGQSHAAAAYGTCYVTITSEPVIILPKQILVVLINYKFW